MSSWRWEINTFDMPPAPITRGQKHKSAWSEVTEHFYGTSMIERA